MQQHRPVCPWPCSLVVGQPCQCLSTARPRGVALLGHLVGGSSPGRGRQETDGQQARLTLTAGLPPGSAQMLPQGYSVCLSPSTAGEGSTRGRRGSSQLRRLCCCALVFRSWGNTDRDDQPYNGHGRQTLGPGPRQNCGQPPGNGVENAPTSPLKAAVWAQSKATPSQSSLVTGAPEGVCRGSRWSVRVTFCVLPHGDGAGSTTSAGGTPSCSDQSVDGPQPPERG